MGGEDTSWNFLGEFGYIFELDVIVCGYIWGIAGESWFFAEASINIIENIILLGSNHFAIITNLALHTSQRFTTITTTMTTKKTTIYSATE